MKPVSKTISPSKSSGKMQNYQLLVAQLLTIPLVILIFKLPAEKKVLSLFANILFWSIGLLTLLYKGSDKKWINLLGLQFIVLAVLPISILRITSWNSDFNTETLLGLSGAEWHSSSNLSFLVMLIGTFGFVVWRKMKPLHH